MMRNVRAVLFWPTAAAAVISIAVVLYLPRDNVRSTGDSGMLGGGSFVQLELERLPAISDIAIIGSIIDVSPARLSTPSGELEIDLQRGPEQVHRVYPYTPVTVRVGEILGVRPSPQFALPDVASADQLQLTVVGGRYTEQLSAEEADALGHDKVDEESGQELPSAERLTYNRSVGTGVSLTEGDRVILFLRYSPLFEGLFRTYSIAGGAVWKLEGSEAKPASESALGLDVSVGELRSLGQALNLQTGPASDPIPER